MIKHVRIVTIFYLLASSFYFLVSPAYAVTEASSSPDIDPEMIRENIKKRIEQAAKSQAETDRKKTAFLGTLNSVTTNSFSLETAQGGVKQASTSAYTTFVDVNNKGKELKFEDVSLGDYIAALGFLDEDTKVLDARRILVLRASPTLPTKKSFFGTLQKVDFKKSTLTIQNPKSNQEKTVTFTSKADFFAMTETSRKTVITSKDVPLNALVIITYTPKASGTGEVMSTLLVKSNIAPAPSPSPSPSPSPKVAPKK